MDARSLRVAFFGPRDVALCAGANRQQKRTRPWGWRRIRLASEAMNTPSADDLRADTFLVRNGYAKSRTEAQSAIRSGRLKVNGELITKPSRVLDPDAAIEYVPPHPYVSRGALKLIAALDHFELSPKGLVCLDVGASTGGFTEVLLERGAISASLALRSGVSLGCARKAMSSPLSASVTRASASWPSTSSSGIVWRSEAASANSAGVSTRHSCMSTMAWDLIG